MKWILQINMILIICLEFYETLNKKNTVDAPLLKIGAGSGLMATSIAMKLKEHDQHLLIELESLLKDVMNLSFQNPEKSLNRKTLWLG